MTSLLPAIFAAHHSRVATALADAGGYFAQYWLRSLASPSGNDILQEVAVAATGRVNSDNKLGADSADGELEAKPFRGGYKAHISDDTPRSLLRHHSIPFIVILQASEDGRQIQWALLTSYRIFDSGRAARMGYTAGALPAEPGARRSALVALEAARGTGVYIRCNPLPLECLEALTPGQYDLWVNPTAVPGRSKAWRLVQRLAAVGGAGMSADFVAETRGLCATCVDVGVEET